METKDRKSITFLVKHAPTQWNACMSMFNTFFDNVAVFPWKLPGPLTVCDE